MLISIILVTLIAGYSLWVIRNKIKNARKGNFCSCGCQDCPSKCHEFGRK